MERPNDIPKDVWDAANAYAVPAAETATRNLDYDDVAIEVHAIRMAVSRAIIAERERCAAIADACAKEYGPENKNDSAGWARELSARLIKRAIMIGDRP